MELSKNQIVELEITGTTHDGSGVGRFESVPVFIPGCAVGDVVSVKIVSVKKSYAYGKVLEVIRPSSGRTEIDCPIFSQCGGCVFRHITYEQELKIKQERVEDALSKIARLTLKPEPIAASPLVNGYRNKAQLPVGYQNGEVCIGYFAPRSHRIVPAQNCKLQPKAFEQASEAFRQWMEETGVSLYDETEGKGLLRHIYIRQAEATGELMACAVINGSEIPSPGRLIELLKNKVPQTASVLLNINRKNSNVILGDRNVLLWGKERITDILCGKRFEISALSFYQVNRSQAEQLYRAAGEFAALKGEEILLDLYCGAGTIGICLSDQVKKLIGVEIVPGAVEDARRNAALNGLTNAEFICADAGTAAARLAKQGLRPDVIIVDPPRKGLDGAAISAIEEMAPDRVIYVSCDPATLARDLAVFEQKGYRCRRIRPFDMFPRTAHVECVVLMSRVKE